MILYLVVFVLSFGITGLVKYFAVKKAIMDIPNERSSHTIPTPRGGGLAIVITWYMGITYLFFQNLIEPNLYYALLCGIVIVGVSLLDDIFGVYFLIRLGSHATAAIGALYFLGGLHKVDFGLWVYENNILFTGIAFIGIVWFINLFNFIDGIDGYAATETIFISLSTFALFSDSTILLMAAAGCGFLYWNWQKAKIFMGDVGSTFIGFTFATYAIWSQNTNQSSILIWFILISVFWFDATLTLYRRFRNGERLSYAHRKHAYQRIVQSGFSHQKTVVFSIALNAVVFLLAFTGKIWSKMLPLVFALTLVFLFIIVKLIDKRKSFE